MAERPSVAPTAVARGGTGGARSWPTARRASASSGWSRSWTQARSEQWPPFRSSSTTTPAPCTAGPPTSRPISQERALAEFRPQDGEVTYAEKIGAEDRLLDWSRPPEELHDRIRALSPHIGARGELHGRAVIVWRSRLDDDRLEILEVSRKAVGE